MPELISKKTALSQLEKERKQDECLICSLNANSKFKLSEDEHCLVMLSAYPRFWGHVIVTLKRHTERFTEISEAENSALFRNAHLSAKVIEKELSPSRCYVASLGSEQNLLNTCPHIHVNVIPVYDKTLRPSEVFTWEKGVWKGTEIEWKMLSDSIKTGFSII